MLHQFYPKKTILPLPYVYLYKKTFYKEISEFFCLFGTHSIARNDIVFDTFSIKWNWEIVDCRLRHTLRFCNMITHRIATSCWLVATMDILNTLIICYWLNFDTQDSMICLSNYLLCLCLTPKLVSFFSSIIIFLSKLLPVTSRRSFLSKGLPHIFCSDPVNTSDWSPISFCMNFY